MLASQSVSVSNSAAVELTAGIDTEQVYMLHIRVDNNNQGIGVYVGNSTVTQGNGYFLRPNPSSVPTGTVLIPQNPEVMLRVTGENIYAIGNSSTPVTVFVLAYSV